MLRLVGTKKENNIQATYRSSIWLVKNTVHVHHDHMLNYNQKTSSYISNIYCRKILTFGANVKTIKGYWILETVITCTYSYSVNVQKVTIRVPCTCTYISNVC